MFSPEKHTDTLSVIVHRPLSLTEKGQEGSTKVQVIVLLILLDSQRESWLHHIDLGFAAVSRFSVRTDHMEVFGPTALYIETTFYGCGPRCD